MLITLFARMKKNSEAEERGERQALRADRRRGRCRRGPASSRSRRGTAACPGRSTACARRRRAAARIAAVAITQDQRDAGDLEVDAEHGEARRAAPGRTPRSSGTGSRRRPRRRARRRARWRWRSPLSLLRLLRSRPASLPACGRARGPSTSRGLVDGAVLDDDQVDGHRQAEDDADQDEERVSSQRSSNHPTPPHTMIPESIVPVIAQPMSAPLGVTGRLVRSWSSVPASRAVLGHRSGHYLSRVARAFPGLRPGPARTARLPGGAGGVT